MKQKEMSVKIILKEISEMIESTKDDIQKYSKVTQRRIGSKSSESENIHYRDTAIALNYTVIVLCELEMVRTCIDSLIRFIEGLTTKEEFKELGSKISTTLLPLKDQIDKYQQQQKRGSRIYG